MGEEQWAMFVEVGGVLILQGKLTEMGLGNRRHLMHAHAWEGCGEELE